jgi:hypothetical protein
MFDFVSITSKESAIESLLAELHSRQNAPPVIDALRSKTRALLHSLSTALQECQLRLDSLARDESVASVGVRLSSSGGGETELMHVDRVRALLVKHRVGLKESERKLHQALLTSRANLTLRTREQREALFSDMPGRGKAKGATSSSAGAKESVNAQYTQKSQDFSRGLRRTKGILKEQIQKSAHALKHLQDSSSTIKDTKDQFDDFGAALGGGKGLLNRLSRRDVTDRLITAAGFLFFLLTVLYIAQRRLGNAFGVFGVLWGYVFGTEGGEKTGDTPPGYDPHGEGDHNLHFDL